MTKILFATVCHVVMVLVNIFRCWIEPKVKSCIFVEHLASCSVLWTNVNKNWSRELFMLWLRIFAIVSSRSPCAFVLYFRHLVEFLRSACGFSCCYTIYPIDNLSHQQNAVAKHHIIFKSNTLFQFSSHEYHHTMLTYVF